ncbi:G5 domain-containing protein [Agromyces sp. MMS24-K17]|uniref:G5 domain-containing protein n=1 Tax=Agromyces sp. MMS24-K17 TaxID=3372850 RepID=UPI0037550150
MKVFWLILLGLVVLGLVITYWYVFLILAAIAAAVVGVIALARGSSYRVKSRTAGAVVVIVSVIALGIGASGAVAAAGPAKFAPQAASRVSADLADGQRETSAPTPSAEPKSKRVVKSVEERSAVPFTSSTVDDPNLAAGSTAVSVVGVAGERVVTYRVILVDGAEVSREVISDVIVTAPVNEVIANGTYVAPPPPAPAPAPAPQGGGCDPNYTGACVPIASDVDCAGGSGNGPEYVWGPVRVVGSDIYDLDRDGDGIACD